MRAFPATGLNRWQGPPVVAVGFPIPAGIGIESGVETWL